MTEEIVDEIKDGEMIFFPKKSSLGTMREMIEEGKKDDNDQLGLGLSNPYRDSCITGHLDRKAMIDRMIERRKRKWPISGYFFEIKFLTREEKRYVQEKFAEETSLKN